MNIGGLGRLIQFLDHDSHRLRELSASTIYELIDCNRDVIGIVVVEGGVDQLLKSTQKTGRPLAQFKAIKILSVLISKVPQAKENLFMAQGIQTLLKVLEADHSTTQSCAAEAIWALVKEDRRMCSEVFKAGGINVLVKLLGKQIETQTKRIVPSILWNMFTFHPESGVEFQRLNGQRYLEGLKRDRDQETKEKAGQVLEALKRACARRYPEPPPPYTPPPPAYTPPPPAYTPPPPAYTPPPPAHNTPPPPAHNTPPVHPDDQTIVYPSVRPPNHRGNPSSAVYPPIHHDTSPSPGSRPYCRH